MPQTELNQYVDEIARLIDDGQADAAIEHCRHILGFYPRYIPAYRLLAQASMRKGDYAHATHFLQSLLSADPEDADAWADLASLSDDLGELEQATWLMERAFEIEPGNAGIRERLRDLYKRRDGIDRPRLKLNPGALGRMYAVGGFHRRAIHELQHILESSPGLPPLHTAYLEVALARAFCKAEGMEDMAERVCQSLISKLPNCFQANLMMGQILLSRGQAEEAEKHLQIARTLDPEGRAAQELLGDRSPIPFERVQIPRLEVGEEATVAELPQVPAQPVEDTSWLDQVGQAFEADSGLSVLSQVDVASQVPGWLGEWSAEEAEQAPLPEEAESPASQPADVEQAGRAAPLPEWMLEALPQETGEEAGATELPAWLSEGPEEQPQPAERAVVDAASLAPPAEQEEEETAELPAWLQELASEAEPAEQLEAVSDEEDTTRWVAPPEGTLPPDEGVEPGQVSGLLAADELPDWLRAIDERDLEEGPGPEGLPSRAFDEELPEWMRTPAVDAEEAGGEELMEEAELPAWLQGLGRPAEEPTAVTDEGASTEVESAPLEEEELPEWLRDLREERPDLLEMEEEPLDWVAEDEGELEAEIEPVDEEELPDWLRELRAQESAVVEPAPEAPGGEGKPETEPPLPRRGREETESLREEELPEWLQELRAQEAAPEAQPSEELAPEGELPDWLREIEGEAAPEVLAEPVREEELPDWLRELRAQEPIPWTEEEPHTVVEGPIEEAPDWLAEIQAEEETELSAEAIDEAALPDWLRELHAQEPALPLDQREEAVPLTAEPSVPPDWLAESEVAAGPGPAAETGEELPEWLRALRAAEAEPESAPSAPVEPSYVSPQVAEEIEPPEAAEIEGPSAGIEMPQPVEGMPAWLRELEAEIAGQPPQALEEAEAEAVSELALSAGPEAPEEPLAVEELPAAVAERAPELLPELQVAEEAEAVAQPAEAEALAEREPELLLEEAVPSPEAPAEPTEAAEEVEAAPEAAVEEMVYEGAPPAVTAEEEAAWVRELEGTPEELGIGVEGPVVVPAEAAVEVAQPQPPAEAPEAAPAAPGVAVPAEQLGRARSHLADRALDDAAHEYEQLLDVPSLHPELVEDLEQAVEAHPDHAPLLRVLGDAYARTGELQKALRTYRQALHKLQQGA